jgi:hypothetical protein
MLTKEDKTAIVNNLGLALSGTPFECSHMSQLGGGSVNFIFRGLLNVSQSRTCNGELITVDSVIIKHSTGYLSCNKTFSLEASRWVCFYCASNFYMTY